MAECNAILGGTLKYRDGRKWKTRYCVLKRLSPVADRLHISLYKDLTDYHRRQSEKQTISLEKFFGIDSDLVLEKERHVMVLICQTAPLLLAAETREELVAWEVTIRAHLGVERQFHIRLLKVPPLSCVPLGPCKLYVHGQSLCITSDSSLPPRILASWDVQDLRRFGLIEGNFCFEVGFDGQQGVYALQSSQGEEITKLLQDAADGKVPKPKHTPSTKRSCLDHSSCSSGPSSETPLIREYLSTQLIYTDLDFVAEEEEESEEVNDLSVSEDLLCTAAAAASGATNGHSSDSSRKQKLVSIDDVRREHFCDIYNVPPRRIVKVQSLEEKQSLVGGASCEPRRFSCGDIDYSQEDAQCPRVAKLSKRRIRRTSYPQPHGAAATQVKAKPQKGSFDFYTTTVQTDVLSPKLRKCDPYCVKSSAEEEAAAGHYPDCVLHTYSLAGGSSASVNQSTSPRMPHRNQSAGLRVIDPLDAGDYLYWSADAFSASAPVVIAGEMVLVDAPKPAVVPKKAQPNYMNVSPTAQQNRAIHGSLKRNKATLESRPPPPSEAELAGTYVRLAVDSRVNGGDTPRPRGRSLENVLESSDTMYAQLLASPASPSVNSASTDYLHMGSLKSSENEPVFCAVELNNSRGASLADYAQRSKPSSSPRVSRSTDSLDDDPSDPQPGYMHMASKSSALRTFGRSMSMSPQTHSRPKLKHTRSWDNELDDQPEESEANQGYLRMGSTKKSSAGQQLRSVHSSSALLHPQQPARKPIKPFDNLIAHQHHLSRRPVSRSSATPILKHQQSLDRGASSEEEKAPSTSSSSSSGSSNGKTPSRSLLSRFIRRSSQSKEKKSKAVELPPPDPPLLRHNSIDNLPEAPPAPCGGQRKVFDPRRRDTDIYVDRSALLSMLSNPPTEPPPPPPRSSQSSTPTPKKPSQLMHLNSVMPPAQSIPAVNISSPGSNDSTPTPTPLTAKAQYVNTDPNVQDLEWAMSQAPALPEKTYRAKLPQGASVSRQESNLSDDVFCDPKGPLLSSVVPPAGAIPQRRGKPSLTVNIPHPAGSRTKVPVDGHGIPVIVDQEESDFFTENGSRGSSTQPTSPCSTALPGSLTKGHRSTNQSEASLSSCGSAETTGTQVAEDLKTSPALTTLRPRSGKEYQRVDRRKLTEELNVPLSAGVLLTSTTQSPSLASTSFSFDAVSLSERKSFSSAWSSGEDSPKYPPSLCSRQSSFREHHYMNLSFSRNESLVIVEATPPDSPRTLSRVSESQLNYAEIDLSDVNGKHCQRVRRETVPTEYAIIDMEATAAASRVGREHARLREDSLLRKESHRLNDRPASASRLAPSAEKKAFLSRHMSLTSKDR